jgi:regulator of protease activity HflC (stomatin/prohibitin superfamily)
MDILGGSALCFVGAILVLGFIFLANAIRIVPEYQRLVVFRLGRSIGAKGPGIILLIPVVDRAVKVDLREQVREIPHQTAITKDNAGISVDFIWYYKVLDPTESVLQVGNFRSCGSGYGDHHLACGHRWYPAGRCAFGARTYQHHAPHPSR